MKRVPTRMISLRLQTAGGGRVKSVRVPDGEDQPEVVTWNNRVFIYRFCCQPGVRVYREAKYIALTQQGWPVARPVG